MVLVDLKYQKPSDRDQAWIDAYNAADFVLAQLINEANNGKAEADGIRSALIKVLFCSFPNFFSRKRRFIFFLVRI